MRVVTDAGSFEIGVTETTPTIGITDYSRRDTDDFGVTTVVERGFARRMSVRMAVPFDGVDTLQRSLAMLRATAATWVADEDVRWLTIDGLYKDFEVDLAVPPVSFCTLTVEGLAETEVPADPGGDPAPEGRASTLQLLSPIDVVPASLVSNVLENDAPAWSEVATYAAAARVVRDRRVFESLIDGNIGNDPSSRAGLWLDTGPTNRWAMFDDALGTVTERQGGITVTLDVGAADAVALLDVSGTTARVQTVAYDQTQAIGEGALVFTGLPPDGAPVTVTIAGNASVGTLLIGRMCALGITEASPTAGITDYSRKEIDDFGEVTIVERAWSKRMSARSILRTDAVDLVADRLARVRAKPSLWVGDVGLDSLIVYGFFREFSIEIGPLVSKLSLSIEGMSKAAKAVPIEAATDWPDVRDPDGTKPADNADVTGDNTAKDTSAVGGVPALDVLGEIQTTQEEIDNLFASMAALAEINGNAIDAINLAQTVTQEARDQSQAARDASQAARDLAIANAAASAASAVVADGFATTASGQATIATQRASAAEQSATIASGHAQTATTKAGEAVTSASQAATSETNAAGSSTSAAAQASVSARAALEGAANSANDNRSPGAAPSLWSYDQYNLFAPTSRLTDLPGTFSFVAGQLRVNASGRHVHPVAPVRLQAGKRYRAFARFRVTEDGPQAAAHNLYVTFFDNAGVLMLGNTVNVAGAPGTLTAGMGFVELSALIGSTAAPGVYAWPAGASFARVMYRSSGTPTEIALLYLEDVEGTLAAEASASASQSSSSTAAASATTAGQHASTAQTQAGVATTKAGEASTSAGSAATSAATADGHRNSAASSAAVVASTYSKVIEASGNEQFDNGTDGWAGVSTSTVVPSIGGRTNVLRTPTGVAINVIGRKVPINRADQKFRLNIGFAPELAGSNRFYLGAAYYDANDALVAATDGTGNYPLALNLTLDASIHGWVDRWAIIGKRADGLAAGGSYPVSTGTLLIPASAVYFRPIMFLNNGATPGVRALIDYFTVEDVTAEVGAARSATASATSASSATASETAAGQSAAAANQHRIDAQVANGSAQSASGVATSQAAVATAEAAAARTSAVLAASVAVPGLGRNARFSGWADGAVFPDVWASYDSSAGAGVVFSRAVNELGGTAMRVVAPAGSNAYIGQRTAAGTVRTGQWLVFEADVMFNGGNWSGTGIYAPVFNSASTASQGIVFEFGGEFGPPVPGRMYRLRKMVQITIADASHLALYPMTHWAGIGSIASATDVTWHYLQARFASEPEIKTGQIDSLSAMVSQQAGVLADAAGKLTAYLTRELVAGGSVARFRMVADGALGSAAELIADAVYLGPNRTLEILNGRSRFNGVLAADAFVLLSNGVAWPVARAAQNFSVTDGQSVSFGANLGAIPDLTFKGENLVALNSGEAYRLYADNLSPTGFVARLRIETPPTVVNHSVSTQQGASGPVVSHVLKAPLPDSSTGNYVVRVDGQATIQNFNNGSEPGYGSIEIRIFAMKAGVWTYMTSQYLSAQGNLGEPTTGWDLAGQWSVQLGSGIERVGIALGSFSGTASIGFIRVWEVSWQSPGSTAASRSATPQGQLSTITVRPQ